MLATTVLQRVLMSAEDRRQRPKERVSAYSFGVLRVEAVRELAREGSGSPAQGSTPNSEKRPGAQNPPSSQDIGTGLGGCVVLPCGCCEGGVVPFTCVALGPTRAGHTIWAPNR